MLQNRMRWMGLLLLAGLAAAVVLGGAESARAALCKKCQGRAYTEDSRQCAVCSGWTGSGAFKLCKACSAKLGQCEACRAPLEGATGAVGPVKRPGKKPPAPEATQPGATTADPEVVAIGQGINQFAFDLYAQLAAQKGNLFYSPQSISTALAMTWAGARGETAAQMAKTLRFPADRLEKPESIHAANAKLLASLSGTREKQGYELSAANALWGQKGYAWLPDFLGVVKTNYGAGLEEVDFVKNAEGARQTINLWVEKETREKIKDLIAQGVLTPLTRLVLTNAIYFKGDWDHAFKKDQTNDEDFFAAGGQKVKAPMMIQAEHFGYMDGGEFQALEMPYKGDALAMVILLPKKKDGLAALEKTLSAEKVAGWIGQLQKRKVLVIVPKFKTTAQFMLADTLKALGMTLAFDPGKADFSGMDGKRDLFISHVIHKAFVDVNEEGTEAAAATAVVMTLSAMPVSEPMPVFRADHPFVFLIRDMHSGCILFVGRVTNPKE